MAKEESDEQFVELCVRHYIRDLSRNVSKAAEMFAAIDEHYKEIMAANKAGDFADAEKKLYFILYSYPQIRSLASLRPYLDKPERFSILEGVEFSQLEKCIKKCDKMFGVCEPGYLAFKFHSSSPRGLFGRGNEQIEGDQQLPFFSKLIILNLLLNKIEQKKP